MDGIEGSEGMFLLGCTNRPLSSLDPASLRPGRLEVHIEVGLPSEDDRRAIATRSLHGAAPADRDDLVNSVVARSNGRTCAEVAALCRLGALNALERFHASPDNSVVSVTLADFEGVFHTLKDVATATD